MENNVKDYVTPQFVRTLFERDLLPESGERWAISICGKIVTINGKVVFPTRAQAVKAFYNSFHWRAMRDLAQAMHPNSEDRYYYWRDPNRKSNWEALKKALAEKFDFKFIQV